MLLSSILFSNEGGGIPPIVRDFLWAHHQDDVLACVVEATFATAKSLTAKYPPTITGAPTATPGAIATENAFAACDNGLTMLNELVEREVRPHNPELANQRGEITVRKHPAIVAIASAAVGTALQHGGGGGSVAATAVLAGEFASMIEHLFAICEGNSRKIMFCSWDVLGYVYTQLVLGTGGTFLHTY